MRAKHKAYSLYIEKKITVDNKSDNRLMMVLQEISLCTNPNTIVKLFNFVKLCLKHCQTHSNTVQHISV